MSNYGPFPVVYSTGHATGPVQTFPDILMNPDGGSINMSAATRSGHGHSGHPMGEASSASSIAATKEDWPTLDLSGRFHHALYDHWVLGPDRSGRFRVQRGRTPIEGLG
jgi:hypothetical protein